MSAASDYTVKRIDPETFELWRADKLLATLSRDEAWPVMMGQVHPSSVVDEKPEASTAAQDGKSKP